MAVLRRYQGSHGRAIGKWSLSYLDSLQFGLPVSDLADGKVRKVGDPDRGTPDPALCAAIPLRLLQHNLCFCTCALETIVCTEGYKGPFM